MRDKDTAVIEKRNLCLKDERQKVSITVEKQDAEIGNTVAELTVFEAHLQCKRHSDERWKK